MSSTKFDNIYKCVLIVLTFAFMKVFYLNVMLQSPSMDSIKTNETVSVKKQKPLYNAVKTSLEDYELLKPVFTNSPELNSYVDEYIDKYLCKELKYDIYKVGENKVSVYLNCGAPSYKIYDIEKKEDVPFRDLTKNYDYFIENSKRLLNLKYPKFVVEDISFDEAIYDIKSNEIVGYYNTKEFNDVTVKINYNEIPDLMYYEVSYDEEYENEIFTLDKDKKTIAFTFDDGPSNYDIDIIDLLKDSHSSATFFVVGNRLLNYSRSVHYMVENDMEVGNHTYDHKSLVRLSPEKVKEEITRTSDIFYEMTNKKITLLRPSYGAINTKVQKEVDMPVILWDVDTLDWKSRNAKKVYDATLDGIQDGSIVLMHSLYESTRDAVEMLLPELYKLGYQVVSVGELAKLKGIELTNDMTIRSFR